MAAIHVGLVGFGYWGPNLARNLRIASRCELVGICDLNPSRLDRARRLFPGVPTYATLAEMLHEGPIEAAAIATPVATHAPLAREALEADLHVLIEKPMAQRSSDCLDLIRLAQDRKRVILVDHTFIYSPAVARIRESIQSGALGDILYIDSTRTNLGLFQPDCNVVWDLAPHDLSIFRHLLGKDPVAVRAYGVSHFHTGYENLAYVTLEYPGRLVGHIAVSWLSPVKLRQMFVGGSRRMIVYNDVSDSEKIKVYEKGVVFPDSEEGGFRTRAIEYRVGDVLSPHIDFAEPLQRECEHFLDCIDGKAAPLTDGQFGYRVVRVIEAIDAAMRSGRAEEVRFEHD